MIVDQLIANPGTLITEGKLFLLFDLAETQRANEEISDVTLSRALVPNFGTCRRCKRKRHKRKPREAESTDPLGRGGHNEGGSLHAVERAG